MNSEAINRREIMMNQADKGIYENLVPEVVRIMRVMGYREKAIETLNDLRAGNPMCDDPLWKENSTVKSSVKPKLYLVT